MKRIISLIISLIVGFILYYLFLPAINLSSFGFWIFCFIIVVVYCLCNILLCTDFVTGKIFKLVGDVKVLGILSILCFIFIICINFILSPLFNSRAYKNRIVVDESTEFINDIALVDFNSLPLLDKDSSQKLGDRVMGQMPELVSQFYVSDLYTQINYNNSVVRVTPLEYDGMIKYFSNRKEGVKGYISVDSVSGEVHLIKLDEGMKYMPSKSSNSKGMASTNRKLPANLDKKMKEEIENVAISAFKALGSSGNSRIDFLIDDKKNKVYINEINSIPGSLAFYLWDAKDINFTQVLEDMINIGIKDYKKRVSKTHSFESNILQGFAANGGAKGVKGAKGKLR